MTREIASVMQARWPQLGHRVFFGRERFERPATDRYVRVMHDEQGGDTFESPGSSNVPVQSRAWWKWVGVRVDIGAQSTLAGAGPEHHQDLAEAIADAYTVALQQVARQGGHAVRNLVGSFVAPPDEQPQEIGARYVMTYEVGRAVVAPAANTGTGVPAVTATVGFDPDPQNNEVACG